MATSFRHFAKKLAIIACFISLLCGCSITKHVPEGDYLLDNVSIKVQDNKDVKSEELINYLRQTPNHRVLGGLRLQLMVYNLAGKDSSKKINKWIKKLGSAPVIYDSALTEASVSQLTKALQNIGYVHAGVKADTVVNKNKRRIKVNYNINTGESYVINSLRYNIPNDTLRRLVMADSALFILRPGNPFNRNNMETERQQITARLRNQGYYAFNKEYITFTVDTAVGSRDVNIVLNLMPPHKNERSAGYTTHAPFFVRKVVFVTNFDPLTMTNSRNYAAVDTVLYKGLEILYGAEHYLRPSIIEECCFIEPGKPYDASDVAKTYEAFGRLGIIKFINIDFDRIGVLDGTQWVDAYILLTRGKSQSISLSLEGTNSEGDLGFGIGAGYQHRNIGKGSETLNAKFSATYESLSGDVAGLINDNYTAYAADLGVTFPKFKAPFLKKSFKQRILATTELAANFAYQERPEFTRVIAGAGWKYHWSEKANNTRHTYDFLDISYVYLPKSRIDFLDDITNPLLRYSYENHFIMRMGYVFYHTNRNAGSLFKQRNQTNIYSIRTAIETAGNTLYGISKLFNIHKSNHTYEIFGINYSQYVKAELDYTLNHKIDSRQMLAFHAGGGIGVPYGNSTILPFEKRFYAGGANGVRGWSVRTLGPGCYNSNNSVNSFINQCGDIRLITSLEYRFKLFWVFELGAFVDAGNIWTIRNYETQPGGVFKFDRFWKQIAMAYGLGLRLDFQYFLLRFDLGMKAYNPASGAEHWAIAHPNMKRDAAFHFSVGYPF